jgi:hypothetical protein
MTTVSRTAPDAAPWIAAAIGPRRVNGRYRSGSSGEEYTVLDIDTDPTGWLTWSVTVANDDEHAANRSRTHCTRWDPRRDQVLIQPAEQPGEDTTTADLSPDGGYRYALTRHWDPTRPWITFIMLNPSTADACVTDATIRRCRDYARRWGGGGLLVLNLFALRATDPRQLSRCPQPVGAHNDAVIATWLRDPRTDPQRVIVAWGAHGGLHGRDRQVLALLRQHDITPHCLRRTRTGQPQHPLRLPATLAPIPYEVPQ